MPPEYTEPSGSAPITCTRPAGHLLQVAAGAGDGAAGAHAGDEMRDPAVGVGPDLRPGGLVVARRVLRVRVLVGLPGARGLRDQPVGHRVVGVGVLRRDRGRADHHLGPVGAQHVLLVLADLVRADEDAAVAALLGDQGEADAGVAAGRLDDGAAGLQRPGLLGGRDHLHRDAVLDRAARVEVLDLGQDQRRHVRRPPGRAGPAGCCRSDRRWSRRTARRFSLMVLW